MTTAGGAPRYRKRRHPALLVTLLLVGCVLAALLSEGAFRLCWSLPPWFAEFQQAGMYVPASDNDVALQPGYRGTLQVDALTTVSINALGMRDREFASKQPGERRLLVLGDSMVWGYGVDVEQALPARLEHELRAVGVTVTVGNGGVPGYGSKHVAQHLLRLDAAFAPDAVVVCGCLGNDSLDDLAPERTVYAGLMMQGGFARLVRSSVRARLAFRSRAWLWFESWLVVNRPPSSLLAMVPLDPEESVRMAGLPTGKTFGGLFLDVQDEAKTWQPGTSAVVPRLLEVLRGSLRSLQQAAGTRPLVFVVLPTSWQVVERRRVEKLQELGFDPIEFDRGLAQRRWLAVAKELGIAAFDATPLLADDADAGAAFISDGGHYKALGNERVAKWLAAELVKVLATPR